MIALRISAAQVLVLSLAACDGETPVAPPVVTELPSSFRIEGSASGADDGLTATCSLHLLFELNEIIRRTETSIEYRGTHGGEVARSVLAADESGFSFVADVFGEVEATVFSNGRLEIEVPLNRDAEGRFWRNLARFEGALDPDGNGGGGVWTCAPFDIDSGGYVDGFLTVVGSWRLVPELSSTTSATGRPGSSSAPVRFP